jgi:redox-sensing transcriptional repressor
VSTSASSLSAARTRGIPDATVARLPIYHRVLKSFSDSGVTTVSSDELARNCGVTPAKLRKDLSHLGSYGTRGVGYDVAFLSYHISRELGLSTPWGVVIVGLGNLGNALVAYRGFATRGFEVVGIVDTHPDVVGTTIRVGDHSLRVSPLAELEAGAEAELRKRNALIGCEAKVARGLGLILRDALAALKAHAEVVEGQRVT